MCGRIFNEGGALYRGGAIYTVPLGLGDTPIFVAALNGAYPPEPCRRYDIAGAVVVPDDLAENMATNADGYQVVMNGDVLGTTTAIGGLFTGTAWGPVGERTESDPFFAARVCNVVVTP
jgi:hypothetical protein